MKGALRRFSVLAVLVGIGLLVLLFVAVPLDRLAGRDGFARPFEQVHGFVFMVYLVTVADLGRRVGWPVRRMVLVMLAGTVPFLSFVVERRMTRDVLAHVPV